VEIKTESQAVLNRIMEQ